MVTADIRRYNQSCNLSFLLPLPFSPSPSSPSQIFPSISCFSVASKFTIINDSILSSLSPPFFTFSALSFSCFIISVYTLLSVPQFLCLHYSSLFSLFLPSHFYFIQWHKNSSFTFPVPPLLPSIFHCLLFLPLYISSLSSHIIYSPLCIHLSFPLHYELNLPNAVISVPFLFIFPSPSLP